MEHTYTLIPGLMDGIDVSTIGHSEYVTLINAIELYASRMRQSYVYTH